MVLGSGIIELLVPELAVARAGTPGDFTGGSELEDEENAGEE